MFIEKGQIKCFNFSFLGLSLRVTYDSDIFEKLRPPMGFQMSEFEFQTFLFCFFIPPPHIWDIVPHFPFFNYDASPNEFWSKVILFYGHEQS